MIEKNFSTQNEKFVHIFLCSHILRICEFAVNIVLSISYDFWLILGSGLKMTDFDKMIDKKNLSPKLCL